MEKYDAVIIGSGTAGQTAAYDLKAAGWTVALVEKSESPGGTCALYGCQPKKWFYEAAEIIARSRHLRGKGITTAAAGDWQGVWAEKHRFTENIPENTVNGLYEAGIDFLEGAATFEDEHILEVDGNSIRADFFVVAAGAKPMKIPVSGAAHLTTSTEFLEQKNLPERIVFVGGGFISFEFAHFAARIGPEERRITILEVGDRPLAPFDADMTALLVEASFKAGIEVHTNVWIDAIDREGDGFRLRTESGQTFAADMVVHGAGRVPAVEDLRLEQIGVEATPKGIRVNDRMQTTVPHIFAAGDCAATPALARVADYEAHTAAKNIVALRKDTALSRIDYSAVPFVLFSYPQYAMVGKTEEALQKEGVSYRKSTAAGLRWPTYRRIGMAHAGYKLLAGENGEILGAHIVSDYAAGLINTFKQAIIDGTAVDKLYRDNIMTPYPTRESDIIYMLGPLLK